MVCNNKKIENFLVMTFLNILTFLLVKYGLIMVGVIASIVLVFLIICFQAVYSYRKNDHPLLSFFFPIIILFPQKVKTLTVLNIFLYLFVSNWILYINFPNYSDSISPLSLLLGRPLGHDLYYDKQLDRLSRRIEICLSNSQVLRCRLDDGFEIEYVNFSAWYLSNYVMANNYFYFAKNPNKELASKEKQRVVYNRLRMKEKEFDFLLIFSSLQLIPLSYEIVNEFFISELREKYYANEKEFIKHLSRKGFE